MAMKIETYYECPICHSSWSTRNEAITCRNQHPIIEKRWANCEVCGQGWNIAYWGENRQQSSPGNANRSTRPKARQRS